MWWMLWWRAGWWLSGGRLDRDKTVGLVAVTV